MLQLLEIVNAHLYSRIIIHTNKCKPANVSHNAFTLQTGDVMTAWFNDRWRKRENSEEGKKRDGWEKSKECAQSLGLFLAQTKGKHWVWRKCHPTHTNVNINWLLPTIMHRRKMWDECVWTRSTFLFPCFCLVQMLQHDSSMNNMGLTLTEKKKCWFFKLLVPYSLISVLLLNKTKLFSDLVTCCIDGIRSRIFSY